MKITLLLVASLVISTGYSQITNAPINAAPSTSGSQNTQISQSAFQQYRSGVLSSYECGTSLDHGIMAVGWATDDETG